jgi:glycosyltransferase involved in cell wall biosynthesis
MPPLCINISSHVEPRFGGIATSMPRLCEALNGDGVYQSGWAAFCLPEEAAPQAAPFWRFPAGFGAWLRGGPHRHRLRDLMRDASVAHIHGLWQAHSWMGGQTARQAKTPYLVSAHGMLDAWAFRHKGWKKRIYSWLQERRNLSQAQCLRALTAAEVADYRRYGVRTPVVVIPNGVPVKPPGSPEPFLDRFPALRDRQRLLFFGRLHRKKGLHLLCQVWGRLAHEFPDAHLIIAGPDEEEIQPELAAICRDAGVADRVLFPGMLQGEMRDSVLAAAGLFLLPSFSEGFSVATLEALGAGVPALVSRQCYFPEIESEHCGWVIEPEPKALEEALRQFFATPSASLRQMGLAGRTLVSARYNWRTIARQFREVFDWLRGGNRPTSVEVWT